MVRMFHPHLEPGSNEIDVPDVPEHIAVQEESGWILAPEPDPIPGHEPDPIVYAPVTKTKRTRGKAKPADDEAESGDESDSDDT